MGSDHFGVDPATLDDSAEILVELSARLQAGRPDTEVVLRGVEQPNVHPDVTAAEHGYITFAADQYQDTVALLAALSSHLKRTSAAYRGIDGDTERAMNSLLNNITIRPGTR
jgi:hypothetical protein